MNVFDQLIDNLKVELAPLPDSKEKVGKIMDFTTTYFDSIGNRCEPLFKEAIEISERIHYKGGFLLAKLNQMFLHYVSISPDKMNVDFMEAERLIEELRDQPFEYTFALNLLAYHHWYRGEFEKAFNKIFEAVKHIDELNGDISIGWIYYALGVFYFDTKDLPASEENYRKSMDFFESKKHLYGYARAQNGVASVKIRQEKFPEAVPLLEEAIVHYRKIHQLAGLGRALNDLSLIEKANKNYKRAAELLIESLEMRKEINHIQGLITTLTELGELYLMMNENEKALGFLKEGLILSDSIKAKYKSIRLHKLLSDAYKRINNIQLAFEHFEKFHDMKSDVMSEESSNNIRKLQTKFETDKSEKEAEIERLKNVELKSANELITEKQKEILDSIRYAKRIQTSLLPTEKYIERSLNRLSKN